MSSSGGTQKEEEEKGEGELDVIVVGAGFAGLYQLYHLRKLGYNVKVLELAGRLGGIWNWQTYPGARVDSEVPVYGFSIEEIWKEWNYTERYPSRAEILNYFEFVDKKLDLSKDVYFNTRVVSAEFDSTTDKWHVHTEGGKEYIAKFLNLCVGMGAQPYEAPFNGIQDFKGVVHHTNKWPEEVELKGKRVAVIGTGSSGVQFIQAVGPHVSHLTVFQRTPNLALPMHNPKLTEEQQEIDRATYPEAFKLRSESLGGYTYTANMRNPFDDPPEFRQAFYEELWAYGDFHFWFGGYMQIFFNNKANKEAYDFWCKKVRARINNPEMQEKLAPLSPPHAFGTKRPSLELNYFEVFNQPNVDLIDIRENPIDCFTPTGIRTKDGINHECDVIVLATGYNSVTGAVHLMNIKGSTGITMKEKWEKGIKTYLGMTSAGFPNMFFHYNAHGPTGLANGPSCIEIQGDWVIKCIDHVFKNGKSRIEATDRAEAIWTRTLHALCNLTLFSKTDSWYMGANIPGKVREPLNYSAGVPMYVGEIGLVEQKGYKGFSIV